MALERLANWLKDYFYFRPPPIFLIDCSATEMVTIKNVFGELQIRICHINLSGAMDKQANFKMSALLLPGESVTSETLKVRSVYIRESAMNDSRKLTYTTTKEKLDKDWQLYQIEHHCNKAWIEYLQYQWIKHKSKWWIGNFQGMLDNQTNKYVESWHEILKQSYLRQNPVKRRPDELILTIFHAVLPGFRIKVVRVALGSEQRTRSKIEDEQRERSKAL